MLLSATLIRPKIPICNPNYNHSSILPLCPNNFSPQFHQFSEGNSSKQKLNALNNTLYFLATDTSEKNLSLQSPNCASNGASVRYVSQSGLNEEEGGLVSSASAVAAAIRKASTSPVEFVQTIEKDGKNGLVLPSSDFQTLCIEQLDLFRTIVDSNAVLTVYVRPAGSYVMDRLELRRVTLYPEEDMTTEADILILIGTFGVHTGLRAAEASLLKQQAEIVPDCRAIVFPMVKHPFVVGFLVAELPMRELETCENTERDRHDLPLSPSQDPFCEPPPSFDRKLREIQNFKENLFKSFQHVKAEKIASAVNISRSLAMAYVMDQKAMLLQQSSWQNNVRMSALVEQVRGPLSTIRTLSKMLSLHMKKSEISYDIVEDMMVQGDHMRETLQQLQDAVYLTKANIVRFNEETLNKMRKSTSDYQESMRSQLLDNLSRETQRNNSAGDSGPALPLSPAVKDLEMPMPPPALAAVQHNTRPCNASVVLAGLVGAVEPLARKQQRKLEFREISRSLQVAVEESALRQALSNLIEGALLRTHVGGKVEIVSTIAPAGGALVIIEDDGLDMHYMTQMHSLIPFGADLFSEGMVEDNMTWNFVAGLTVAREILENYGCVVRVISPRTPNAALGAGGTRLELWLPSLSSASDPNSPVQEV